MGNRIDLGQRVDLRDAWQTAQRREGKWCACRQQAHCGTRMVARTRLEIFAIDLSLATVDDVRIIS
ncbi:MAG: hypothetical protein VX819_02300 [Pseudomonadota bacterium]|nr:hypothetical protein [Pseudomonadota bacterium]MEC8746525.1 hypothetical protein [Pseudomonadota bacterium]MED5539350.1 hypothetical protein [Pseudomonadota bacterium]